MSIGGSLRFTARRRLTRWALVLLVTRSLGRYAVPQLLTVARIAYLAYRGALRGGVRRV